eukprot:TRINITY_DN2701_c0_g1_i1.p1 TRINITY_DN2701_c0_g1~~TRINITY_DN2701_c0_g1_i1.p1  ORF type:complete len:362 (+),score=76.38 TRINITY_DN2701_c0_g1_i1:110-1087(+)
MNNRLINTYVVSSKTNVIQNRFYKSIFNRALIKPTYHTSFYLNRSPYLPHANVSTTPSSDTNSKLDSKSTAAASDPKHEKTDTSQKTDKETDTSQETDEETDDGEDDSQNDYSAEQPQTFSTFQFYLLVLGIPALLTFAGYRWLTMFLEGRNDTTKEIDMRLLLEDLFHSSVYTIIDNREVNAKLGGPLHIDSNSIRFGWSPTNAWILFPVISASARKKNNNIGHVSVDLYKTGNPMEPHEWQIENIEVDYNDGSKSKIPVRWKPFNAVERFEGMMNKIMEMERKERDARDQKHKQILEDKSKSLLASKTPSAEMLEKIEQIKQQ